MKSRALAALAGLAALGICITASAAPLEAYSRLPAMSDVELSDDGQNIAYVATNNEQSRVVVQRLDGTVLQVIELGAVKVANLQWGSPDHLIIATRTTSRVRNMTLRGELMTAASLNIRTGRAVQFFERLVGGNTYATALFSAPVAGVWEGTPVAFVVVYATGVQGDRLDVVRIDLETGIARTHAMGNENTYDFLVLPDGSVPAKSDYNQATGDWSVSVRDGGGWRVAHRVNAPIDTPDIEALTENGDAVYISILDRGTGDWRMHPVSLANASLGAPTLPPEARRLLRDQNARAIGYVTVGETWDYHFFDPAREAAWQLIASSLRGRLVSFESATPDFSKLVFYVEGPGHPGNFVLFDASSRSLTQIGRAYPDIAGNEVAQVQAIEYPAADGLMIPAYLTLPLGRQPHDLPLVILAHGGPQARDYGGFEWMAQGLASRGYAVLQPNFRGSGGYGTAFIEAGYGQWGRKMQTDLSDGIAFLASQGIVDPARACIMGASYGGYAALAGVTLQRDVYRCAVAIAPVSDVRDFLAWRAVRSGEDTSTLRYWTRYLGVTDRNDRRLDEISTVRAAGGDDAPVLLIHGRDDTIVPYQQSEAAQRALSAAGRTVELVPLRQEDHYLSREATRVQTLNAAVAFIEQHNPPN